MNRALLTAAALVLTQGAVFAQDYGNVETVVTGLTEPVSLSAVPGDDTRLIVAERAGRLRVITVQTDAQGNKSFTLQTQPFLDLAALDAANPFFRDSQGNPLHDQSGAVVPRLVRHGGLPVPYNAALWYPSREVEQGFYSVAFAPDYATSGRLCVNYNQSNPNTDPNDAVPDGAIDWTYFVSGGNYCTQNGRSAILEFRRDPLNPDRVDPTSERLILAVPKPYPGHNGGTLRFGQDGMLWFGLGDGGSVQDDENRAQDPNQLFGKLIRIDVSGGAAADDFPADPLRNYTIPPGNAYPGGVGGAPEVLARGLRNPWQWSFDRWNGDLWLGDVGNNLWEEIDYAPAGTVSGRNFGWRAREGNRVTGLDTGGFDLGTLTAPSYAYPHSAGQPDAAGYAGWQAGVCNAGGVVYRGGAIRPWRGRFIFADTYYWTVWSAQVGTTGAWSNLQDWSALLVSTVGGVTPPQIRYTVSFAQDNDGEIYFVEYVSGRVRRIVPQGVQPPMADVGVQGGLAGSDGNFDNNDFVVFIDWFFNHDPRADMGKQGGIRGVDQQLDNNDFVAFIDAFFNGN